MTRIKQFFSENPERKALVSFLTAGDPTPPHTGPAMHAFVEGGADILEVGVPFSDPEAEGPAIQAANERALANGMSLAKVLQQVAQFRLEDSQTPVILMGYLNSVLAMSDFAARAQRAGVDGLIMVNLPPESGSSLKEQLEQHDIDLIYLVAPTTTHKRAQLILNQASGFVYYVSLKGITGAGHLDTGEVAERLEVLRSQTDLPICVGFGIKDPATAKLVAPFADGVVVGSALVNLLYEHKDNPIAGAQALKAAVAALRASID